MRDRKRNVTDDALLIATGRYSEAASAEPGHQAVHHQPQADQAAVPVCAQPGQVRPELRHP